MKLSERFYEMRGLTFEGGEERTYSIMKEITQLEAENVQLRAVLSEIEEQCGYIKWIEIKVKKALEGE